MFLVNVKPTENCHPTLKFPSAHCFGFAAHNFNVVVCCHLSHQLCFQIQQEASCFRAKKRKLWKPHYKTSAPKQMEDLVTTLWIAAQQFATSEWNIFIIFSKNGLMVMINANLTPGCVNKHLLMNIMTTNNIPVLWFQLFLPFPKDWLLHGWCFKLKHFFALIIQRDRGSQVIDAHVDLSGTDWY